MQKDKMTILSGGLVMENKIYFKVQDVTRVNCGYKTYTRTVEKVTCYEKDEIKKAIKHFKKRKANDIIMCCVEYLEHAPYVKVTDCFGEEVFGEYEDGHFKKYIEFNEFDVKYEI
jgi:hypothetical protein